MVVPFWIITLVLIAFPIFDKITEFEVTVPIMNCCSAVALVVSAVLYIFSTIFVFNGARSLSPAIIAIFAKFIGFAVVVASLMTLLVDKVVDEVVDNVVDKGVTKVGTQEPFLAKNQQLSLICFSNIALTNW